MTSDEKSMVDDLDDRSVVIACQMLGTLTFQQSGRTAMSAVDDVMPTAYGESWDVLVRCNCTTAGQTAKATAIGGYGTDNSFIIQLHQKWLMV